MKARMLCGWLLLSLATALGALENAAPGDRGTPLNIVFPSGAFSEKGGVVYDLSKAPFNAVGDGKTDNTRSFIAMMNLVRDRTNAARSNNNETGTTNLWFWLPNGTYLVSDSLVHEGECVRGFAFLRLLGQDRRRTVIRLRDGCPGFGSGERRPVLSWSKDPDRHQGNVAWGNELCNLTVDTGRGNPGAVGVLFLGANACAIGSLTIRSGDGLGHSGLSLPIWSVQGRFADITVEGFDYGIEVLNAAETNPTFEHVTLTGQGKAGLRVGDGSPCVRSLLSRNRVPAALVEGRSAQLVLLGSDLTAGDAGLPAVRFVRAEAQGFLRDVQVSGYGAAVVHPSGNVAPGRVGEWVSGKVTTLGATTPPRSLDLPIEDSPQPVWVSDPSLWALPEDFQGDDRARIQAALSSGKPAVLLPRGDYCRDKPVGLRVPKTVRQIEMLGSSVWAGFDVEASTEPLQIEHLGGRMTINLKGPRTLVVRSGVTRYECFTDQPAVAHLEALCLDGKLPRFCPPNHRIYARSINNECMDKPNFNVDAGLLWVLGYKTEGPSECFHVRHGGILEVLGGYRNQTMTDGGRPMLLLEDGHASFIGYSSMDRIYREVIWARQGDDWTKYTKDDFPVRAYRNGNCFVPLWNYFDPARTPRAVPRQPVVAKPAVPERPAPPPPPKVDPRVLTDWQKRLIERINRCAGEGKPLQAMVRIDGKLERRRLVGADERELWIEVNGNRMPFRWGWLAPADRLDLVKSIATDEDLESQLILAVFLLAMGQREPSEDALARAALLDVPAATALRQALHAAPAP